MWKRNVFCGKIKREEFSLEGTFPKFFFSLAFFSFIPLNAFAKLFGD
jgi:hypothetical protein